MSNLIVVLTGGIGSGKTTVANYFRELGITIIDTDVIAREIVKPGSPLLQKITAKFSNDILLKDGSLNRQLLQEKIFQNKDDRLWLENLLHPAIYEQAANRAKENTSPYCVLVVPLLIETFDLFLNYFSSVKYLILAVEANEQLRKERIKQRDNLNAQQIEKIIQAQTARQERLALADDVIENDKDSEKLRKKVQHLHQNYSITDL
jgi:dephospho-CoA kinase